MKNKNPFTRKKISFQKFENQPAIVGWVDPVDPKQMTLFSAHSKKTKNVKLTEILR